jgi:hypothetical protein
MCFHRLLLVSLYIRLIPTLLGCFSIRFYRLWQILAVLQEITYGFSNAACDINAKAFVDRDRNRNQEKKMDEIWSFL